MPFFVNIAIDKQSDHRAIGPFETIAEARERGLYFASEGLDVVISREDSLCDFCSSPDVHKRFIAADIIVPEVGWASRGDWGACKDCYAIVTDPLMPDEMKLDALGERSAESAKLLHGDDIVNGVFFEGVRMIQTAFFMAWTGEVVEP